MSRRTRLTAAGLAGLGAIVAAAVSIAAAGPIDRITNLDGTIWVANRGAHTIRGFDAATGAVVADVNMLDGSQPGDLAYARGKLYVAEEFGSPPAIAIVDASTGAILNRIFLAAGSRPHHVHASRDGRLVAVGLYATDTVAVVDTRTDSLLGPWDTNPAAGAISGRAHAGVFSPDGRTLYVASDASNEVIALDPLNGTTFWRLPVVGAHELAVARDGESAFVARRTANTLSLIDLDERTYTDVVTLGLPDTLRLVANGRRLTVGLRTAPARLAVLDTRSSQVELVGIGPVLDTNTIAGHQWTSRNGRYTFAAYEGGANPGVAVVDHKNGNRIVATLAYPGRPHGIDFAPAERGDDGDDSITGRDEQ
jgi:DNA-binding beta-propeller fold protein YncE